MLILNNQLLFITLKITVSPTAFIILEHAEGIVFKRVFTEFFAKLILENNAQFLVVNQTHMFPSLVKRRRAVVVGDVTEWSNITNRSSLGGSDGYLACC